VTGMKLTKTEREFDPDVNIFAQDAFHMGTVLAENILILHANHPHQRADYLLIVNRETGEQYKLTMENARRGHLEEK